MHPRRTSYAFPRSQRLSRAREIETVKRTGVRIKTGALDVRVALSSLPYPRVGIIVAKHKRSIVERNKLRRRLRELVRTKILPVAPPKDILIRTFPHAYTLTFNELDREIDRVVTRIA